MAKTRKQKYKQTYMNILLMLAPTHEITQWKSLTIILIKLCSIFNLKDIYIQTHTIIQAYIQPQIVDNTQLNNTQKRSRQDMRKIGIYDMPLPIVTQCFSWLVPRHWGIPIKSNTAPMKSREYSLDAGCVMPNLTDNSVCPKERILTALISRPIQ